MDYIKQLNAFWRLLPNNPLSSNAVCLYVYLLSKDNEFGWKKEFMVPNLIICGSIGLSRQALDRARNELIQKGYIRYKKGISNQAGKYVIVCFDTQKSLSVDFVTQNDTQDKIRDDIQKDIQGGHEVSTLNKRNKTKLNNKLNEFNLYHNFEQNVKCDCVSKSTKEQCQRRSSYCINGKNYCNQHSRGIIERYIGKNDHREISKHGEYGNVKLDDEQYEKLIVEFPKDYEKRIQSLDDYIQCTGKKYKDHLATIRNWARKEGYKRPEKVEYKVIDTEGLTDEEYEKLLRERRNDV